MQKRTAKRTANGALQAALNRKPDYSERFTREVSSVAHAVGDVLSAPVEHDDDMNYSDAQKIVVWLDSACRPVPPRDRCAIYRLFDYVSSRGRYFAFVTLKLSAPAADWKEKGLEEPRQYWILAANDDLPDTIKALQKRIVSVMKSKHYTWLEGPVLSQEVEGHLTELDSRRATVFEVLFSEVY